MQEFVSISLLIMLAAISPGPDFAVVTKNSLLYSRKVGVLTALGVQRYQGTIGDVMQARDIFLMPQCRMDYY